VTEAGCTFTLSAASRSVTAAGIQGSAVTVGAPPGCAWSATSNEAWITISSGESGTGGGQVVFTAADNQGPARAGSITIAGTMFTVNQSGAK
jgi:hypothetical protein